ncbi:protein CLEC16A homolog isoform X3 [Ixodes scapularis]|uniref:protein CLEC16A homolog isoform X3 n=1 Tax=Ixodes scapularis TaxID=6945 RepID=UPI001A9F55E9|nr:protein CLEC16A homolog isoform X3 [Ixodes scapularis]
MFRNKGWFSGGLWKPKNPHSLEHLKYLYHLLSKNQTVTEQNKGVLVETLRSIAEILIWGDQNDSTVFDFFLEKNMLSFFLKIMKQKCGRYVCIQLLQTLNILFENIRNETSLYYLLSNNHVNSIIVHKFDFSDEEVMAYYISFLKTLSLKLNNHTIHFFYNEHTNDFPLYTEAIKFFNHTESMVRIAVRTLTLNVFKEANNRKPAEATARSKRRAKNGCVEDKAMLKFIRDRTAAPYFSNLVYFIGKHVIELDTCVINAEHGSSTRLADLVAEHLDHLHYVNDILCLHIEALNAVLTDHLLHRLLVPLYVYSLVQGPHPCLPEDRKRVSSVVSLFLLSQVFLIVSHQPLVRQLANIILNRDMKVFAARSKDDSGSNKSDLGSEPEFLPPEESLEKSLETSSRAPALASHLEEQGCRGEGSSESGLCPAYSQAGPAPQPLHPEEGDHPSPTLAPSADCEFEGEANPAYLPDGLNITDEQKAQAVHHRLNQVALEQLSQGWHLCDRPFLGAILHALDCSENDHPALFALCLLYALGHNPGINEELLDTVLTPSVRPETRHWYNVALMEKLIQIISLSCKYGSKVRLATLEMSILLLKQLVTLDGGESCLQDVHLAGLEQAREESSLLLRNFYKSEEIFLDMFEDEFQEMKKKPLNVEYLMMDANLLLPPMGTPMTGIEFHKRLPCGEVERARRAIRVFLLLRELSLALTNEKETQLPLTNLASCVKVDDVLDLNNSDLIACTVVVSKESQKIRRFMVIDVAQLVLVEPDSKRLGWGVAKFVGFLQDIEVTGDKEDSRCLHITVHGRGATGGSVASGAAGRGVPLLAARFLFDDHIRCMAAKQRLNKGRLRARQRKMHHIARLLDMPLPQTCPPASPLRHHHAHLAVGRAPSTVSAASGTTAGLMHRSQSQDTGLRGRKAAVAAAGGGCPAAPHQPYRPLFTTSTKLPGFAEARTGHRGSAGDIEERRRRRSGSSPVGGRNRSASRSRESSPRLSHRPRDQSEEIPLEDLSRRGAGCQVAPSPCGQEMLVTQGCGESPHGSPLRLVTSRSETSSPMDQQSATPECPAGDAICDGPAVVSSLLGPPSGSTRLEVPVLLPPCEGSVNLLPSPPSDLGESPTGECQKPCCMSETSFSEESSNEARSNGELKPPVRSPSEVELCLNEGDDQFDEESLNVGGCAAAPKPKGAVHTV